MDKPINKEYLENAFKSFDTEVSEKKYLHNDDPSIHTHDNKNVLEKFSESDKGVLLFDGEEIGRTDESKPLSAYEIAVNNGFAGTELEWLESLKGDRGEADLSNITPEDIGAADSDHSHGYLKTVTLSTTEPTAVAEGEIIMVYEE